MFSFDPKTFKFKVNTDSDGVIFNFNKGFSDLFGGKKYEDLHPEYIWETITATPQFFADLELLDGAKEYWEIISHFDPLVLTGCPREPGFAIAAAAKRQAFDRHFGTHVRMEACMSWRKQEYITQPGDILIDDNQGIIDRWRKAGGTGILFVNAAQAIEEFYNTVEALNQVA